MRPPGPEAAARFAAAVSEVHAELDWALLGRLACEGDGSDFFPPQAREAVLESGLLLADDLAGVLRAGGSSVYLGAAVAELAPILCEHLVLERTVHWHNLPGPETDELNRALAAAEQRLAEPLPRVAVDGIEVLAPAGCDHAWCVSVLTDPEHFPALHDRLYGRTGEGATGRGVLEEELAEAQALLGRLLGRLWTPAVLTTTDEELALVQPACARLGWRCSVPDVGRLSGIVGDVVRVCHIEATRA